MILEEYSKMINGSKEDCQFAMALLNNETDPDLIVNALNSIPLEKGIWYEVVGKYPYLLTTWDNNKDEFIKGPSNWITEIGSISFK